MKRSIVFLCSLSVPGAMDEVLRNLTPKPKKTSTPSPKQNSVGEEKRKKVVVSEDAEEKAKQAFSALTSLLSARGPRRPATANPPIAPSRLEVPNTNAATLREHILHRSEVEELRAPRLESLRKVLRAAQDRVGLQQQSANLLLSMSERNGTLSLLPKEQWRDLTCLPPDRELQEAAACFFRMDGKSRPLVVHRTEVSDLQINEVIPGGSLIRLPYVIRHENRIIDPPEDPSFCHLYFTLHTGDMATVTALTKIAKVMSLPISRFSATQLLEARSSSTQICSVELLPERRSDVRFICDVNSQLAFGCKIFPFAWQTRAVRLGEVKSNYHSILLRQCPERAAAITNACMRLMETGFLNYFGLRKFGYYSFGYQDIGIAVMRKNFGAAMAMLAQNEAEKLRVTDLRELLDAVPWARRMHDAFVTRDVNSKMFQKMYVGLPEHVRMQHRVAVQAYAWNILASGRRSLPDGKDSAVAGDTVLENEAHGLPAVSTAWEAVEGDVPMKRWLRQVAPEAQPLEVTSHDIPLTEVVIAIPFSDPQTKCALEKEVRNGLGIASLDSELFDLGVRTEHATTEYRPLVVCPSNFTFYVIPEEGDVGEKLKLNTDEQICVRQPQNLRSTFATQHASLIAQRLPQGAAQLSNTKSATHGNASKHRTRALALGGTIPPTSYVSSMLREIARLVRSMPQKSSNKGFPATEKKSNGAATAAAVTTTTPDTRTEFNAHDFPATGNIMDLKFHNKPLKDAAASGITPKGKWVLRNLVDWKK